MEELKEYLEIKINNFKPDNIKGHSFESGIEFAYRKILDRLNKLENKN